MNERTEYGKRTPTASGNDYFTLLDIESQPDIAALLAQPFNVKVTAVGPEQPNFTGEFMDSKRG